MNGFSIFFHPLMSFFFINDSKTCFVSFFFQKVFLIGLKFIFFYLKTTTQSHVRKIVFFIEKLLNLEGLIKINENKNKERTGKI